MRTLLVDNYDSYTNNFITLWCEALKKLYSNLIATEQSSFEERSDFLPKQIESLLSIDFMREHLVIIRNNQYSWDHIRQKILPYVDNVIISPGPGKPENDKDFGVCADIIKNCDKPILGVCLGHQGIAYQYGSKTIKAKIAVHGQKSELNILESLFSDVENNFITPDETVKTCLFDNIPQNIRVVRYHSLVVDPDSLSEELVVLAKSTGNVETLDSNGQLISVIDEEIMALRHKKLPLYGVQFHPESIETEYGLTLLLNFLKITIEWNSSKKQTGQQKSSPGDISLPYTSAKDILAVPAVSLSAYSLLFSNLVCEKDRIEKKPHINIFEKQISVSDLLNSFISKKKAILNKKISLSHLTLKLFDALYSGDPAPFLFDCSKENVHGTSTSIMGSLISPKNLTVKFDTNNRTISIENIKYNSSSGKISSKLLLSQNLNHLRQDKQEKSNLSFFGWAQKELIEPICQHPIFVDFSTEKIIDSSELNSNKPSFRAGWVGYVGYEMHSESDVVLQPFDEPKSNNLENKINDTLLTLATQSVVLFKSENNNGGANKRVESLSGNPFSNRNKNPTIEHNDESFFIYLYAIFQDYNNNDSTENTNFENIPTEFSINSYKFDDKETSTKWILESTRKIIEVLEKVFEEACLEFSNTAQSPDSINVRPRTTGFDQRGDKNVQIVPRIPKELYLEKIRESQSLISLGESYELCLTNKFRLELGHLGSYAEQKKYFSELYLRYLRVMNPAPMGAFFLYPKSTSISRAYNMVEKLDSTATEMLKLGGDLEIELEIELGILSCSPERFLRVKYENSGNWVAQMKPIKGTVKRIPHGTQVCSRCNLSFDGASGREKQPFCRAFKKCEKCMCSYCCEAISSLNEKAAEGLKNNTKEQAENLMIVDLVRHDLAAACLNNLHNQTNPIARKVNALETFETVFQLVSTIEAQLYTKERHIPNIMEVMGRVFPPGSMTGAPKSRSVELLKNDLENNAKEGRGLYSGCIGYISAYQGQMDWSVVIRTLVAKSQGPGKSPEISVDAGGAITILSDPQSEWDEVLTKLDSILYGVNQYISSR